MTTKTSYPESTFGSKHKVFICVLTLATSLSVFCESAKAVYTEVGISYSRKRTSFDSNNYTDSESGTGSVSLYFFEKVAFEISYTDASSVRQEKIGGSQYTTFQKTKVLGGDLIYVFADKKATFQPFIKGGAAQLHRQQTIQVDSLDRELLDPEVAVVPSYGAGLKIAITESLNFKLSYDAWKTPIGGDLTTDDTNIRAGISWIL
jgi:outer membrane protein W